MNILKCKNATKKYGTTTALDNLSLSLEENKIIGLIGRNGAGKTTFLKSCAGYLRLSSGEFSIWDEPIFDNLNVISRLIFIDEDIQYDDSLTLNDILALARLFYPDWDNKMSIRLLDYFELNSKKKYKKLSRGMKTQFNIIMGICSRMPLTLFDEPTLGLDAAFRKEFYKILLNDYLNHPRTIIISSHLLSEIENLLEEIVLINKGSLVFHSSMEDVQNYAINISGKKEVLSNILKDRDVLYREQMGALMTVGIKNDWNENELEYFNTLGLEYSKMQAQDVCIHMTSNGKEGVFEDE